MHTGYIYVIENKKNGKVYVGQTSRDVETRYKEHLRSAKRGVNQSAIYRAIRKYGKSSFAVHAYQKIPEENLDEAEIKAIAYFKKKTEVYNETIGGEGVQRKNIYDISKAFLESGMTIKDFAKTSHMKPFTISRALQDSGFFEKYLKKNPENNPRYGAKAVVMVDVKNGEALKVFPSMYKAYKFLDKKENGKIRLACQEPHRTSYGYKWRFLNEMLSEVKGKRKKKLLKLIKEANITPTRKKTP